MDTAGNILHEYPLTLPNAGLTFIATGADGALWFTELDAGRVGRMTASGALAEYPVPERGGPPVGITRGPDGNIWFAMGFANTIGQVVMPRVYLPLTVK